MKSFSLDSFKTAVKTDVEFRDFLSGVMDSIDFDNGTAIIHRNNINKYLEEYCCKDEDDLEETLWFNYGIFTKII